MKSYNFPILSAVMLMPMIVAPLFYIFLQQISFLPDWLESDVLASNYFIAVIVASVFFIFFSYHEKKIQNIKFYSVSNFYFAFLGFFISATLLSFDIREIAQSLGGNVIFSFLNLFFLAALIPFYKPKYFGILICLIAGLWFGSSGSKASLFSIILLWIVCSGNTSFKYFLYLMCGLIFISIVDLSIFMRYMDVGISMLNSMQVCEYSDKSLMQYYYEAFTQYFITGSTFNPTMTFYLEAGIISAGYNVTPTVIGDIVCRPNNFLIFLFPVILYLHLSLVLGYKMFEATPWVNNFHILVLLGIMSSSTFDIIKFEILFWIVGISYIVIKTYIDKYNYKFKRIYFTSDS